MRVRSASATVQMFLRDQADAIRLLVRTSGLPVVEAPSQERAAGTVVSAWANALAGSVEIHVNLRGLVEAGAERARIERELRKIDRELATLEKKLGATSFVDRAPREVVEEAQAQKAALFASRAGLEAARRLAEEL